MSGRFGVARQPCCWQQDLPAQHFRGKKNIYIFSSLIYLFISITFVFFSVQENMTHMLQHINSMAKQAAKTI